MADEAKVTITGENKQLVAVISESQRIVEQFAAQYNESQKQNTQATQGFDKALRDLSGVITSSFGGEAVQNVMLLTQAFMGNAEAAEALGAKIASAVVDEYRQAMKIFSEAEIAAVRLQYALDKIGEGATFDRLDAFATKMENSSIFGKNEEIIGAVQSTTKFKTITEGMREEVTSLAADIASLEGTSIKGVAESLSRALDSPQQGMRLLRQWGVQFTEDQKDLIKHLEETGQHAKAQGIIIGELSDKFAGAKEVIADTVEGGWKRLDNAWGQLEERAVRGLAPAIRELQETLISAVQEGQELLEWASEMEMEFEKFMNSLVGWIDAPIDEAVEAAKRKLSEFWAWANRPVDEIVAELQAAMAPAEASSEPQKKILRKETKDGIERTYYEDGSESVSGTNEAFAKARAKKMADEVAKMKAEEANEKANKAFDKSLDDLRRENQKELQEWEKQTQELVKAREARAKMIVDIAEQESAEENKRREKRIKDLEKSTSEEKKAAEKAIRDRVKDSDFTASFRGLEDQFKSMQAAAASRETPEAEIKKEIEESNKKLDAQLGQQKTEIETLQRLEKVLGDLTLSGGMV